MPFYLFVCFAFHPWIGYTAIGGAALLVSMTILTEGLTRKAAKEAVSVGALRRQLADAGTRNAEVVHAMGMSPWLAMRWSQSNDRFLMLQRKTADVAGGLGAISKVLRMMLQSAVLGVGAYLVIDGQATGGIMIASSILVGRALAPVELAIANWKNFIIARQGWKRLREALAREAHRPAPLRLPPPRTSLSVESASAGAPGAQRLSVLDLSFELSAGSALGVIGPSASGKSSLARMLVGVWPAARGKVRLDGAALEQWDPDELGRHVGYLPQDVELFGGTIAQNIARFLPDAPPDAVLAAARAANVHELILRLPEGYETQIGEGGAALSAGQRQRIALARALYGDPFLVVLDEPNSNLDADGEQALTRAILGVRNRGGVVVVIAHRPSALAGVDHVLMMEGGTTKSFGPKEEVLKRVLRTAEPQMPNVTPLRVAGV
jgi:ATP-binding cassette subfamily C protein